MTASLAERVRFVSHGLDHSEGLSFAPDGSLSAGGGAGQIYRIDLGSGHAETIASTGGLTLGMCADA